MLVATIRGPAALHQTRHELNYPPLSTRRPRPARQAKHFIAPWWAVVHANSSDLPGSRSPLRDAPIRCGGTRTTRSPAANNACSSRRETWRQSSIAHTRSSSRPRAHRTAARSRASSALISRLPRTQVRLARPRDGDLVRPGKTKLMFSRELAPASDQNSPSAAPLRKPIGAAPGRSAACPDNAARAAKVRANRFSISRVRTGRPVSCPTTVLPCTVSAPRAAGDLQALTHAALRVEMRQRAAHANARDERDAVKYQLLSTVREGGRASAKPAFAEYRADEIGSKDAVEVRRRILDRRLDRS